MIHRPHETTRSVRRRLVARQLHSATRRPLLHNKPDDAGLVWDPTSLPKCQRCFLEPVAKDALVLAFPSECLQSFVCLDKCVPFGFARQVRLHLPQNSCCILQHLPALQPSFGRCNCHPESGTHDAGAFSRICAGSNQNSRMLTELLDSDARLLTSICQCHEDHTSSHILCHAYHAQSS